MGNNIGRMKCAVCGCNTWVRENKNGILYANCTYHHQTKLNGDDSIKAKEALKQGKSWNNGLIFIYPNERTENGTNTNTNGTSGTVARADNYRRTDGQPATTTNGGTGATDNTRTDADESIGIGCF